MKKTKFKQGDTVGFTIDGKDYTGTVIGREVIKVLNDKKKEVEQVYWLVNHLDNRLKLKTEELTLVEQFAGDKPYVGENIDVKKGK